MVVFVLIDMEGKSIFWSKRKVYSLLKKQLLFLIKKKSNMFLVHQGIPKLAYPDIDGIMEQI